MWDASFTCPHLFEHRAIWFEDFLEMSKNFDAPIRWIVRAKYFYSWRTPRFCEIAKDGPAKRENECNSAFYL